MQGVDRLCWAVCAQQRYQALVELAGLGVGGRAILLIATPVGELHIASVVWAASFH